MNGRTSSEYRKLILIAHAAFTFHIRKVKFLGAKKKNDYVYHECSPSSEHSWYTVLPV